MWQNKLLQDKITQMSKIYVQNYRHYQQETGHIGQGDCLPYKSRETIRANNIDCPASLSSSASLIIESFARRCVAFVSQLVRSIPPSLHMIYTRCDSGLLCTLSLYSLYLPSIAIREAYSCVAFSLYVY